MNDAVEVTYVYGTTTWIYPDKPVKTIGATSFPRIRVGIVSNPGRRLGNFEAPVEGSIRFQIDIWCKESADGQIFTIGGDKYTGEDLAEYLAYQITEAFEDHESDLHPALYGYVPMSMPMDMPFDVEMQAHRKTVEFIMSGLELGRIS